MNNKKGVLRSTYEKKNDVPKFKSDDSASYSRSRMSPRYVNQCNMLGVRASSSQYEAVILGPRILTPLNRNMSSIFHAFHSHLQYNDNLI